MIPVLLNGTPLPDVATLPDDLKGITTRQTVPFRSKFAHIDWIPLIERLRDIHGIGKVPPHPGPAVLPPRVSRRLDLQVLDDLLSTRRWEEADRESARMLYAAAGGDPDTSRAHLIRYDQIDDIAPEDLDAIDRLWRHYSDGRFGLTAQLNALRQAQGDLRAFAREIGWYTDRWIFYAEARFKTSAPVGHLPILGPVGGVRPPWRFRYLRDGTMGVLRMPVELTKYLSDRETVQRVHDRPVDESLGWTEYSRMVSHATFEVVADAFKGRARTLRKLYTEAPARRMVSYYTQLISVVWAITRVRLLDRLD